MPRLLSLLFLDIKTRNSDIPIRRYKIFHTGPKTQFGGLKIGLSSVKYHGLIFEIVKNEPTIPAEKDMRIE